MAVATIRERYQLPDHSRRTMIWELGTEPAACASWPDTGPQPRPPSTPVNRLSQLLLAVAMPAKTSAEKPRNSSTERSAVGRFRRLTAEGGQHMPGYLFENLFDGPGTGAEVQCNVRYTGAFKIAEIGLQLVSP